MKALKYINKKVWIVSALLFLFGCGFFTVISSQDASGKALAILLAMFFIGIAVVIFVLAYFRAKKVLNKQETNKKMAKQFAADLQAERNEYQYTFEGAQTVVNHIVIDYAPTGYDEQVFLYSLNVGDEIHVFRNYEGKYTYTMYDDIPLPPRLVNIYERKRICRLYVYKINDDNPNRRAIQILAVYNPE